MATIEVICISSEGFTYDPLEAGFDGGLHLRRQNERGDYDPNGVYPEEAVIESRNYEANAIVSLYSFEATIEQPVDPITGVEYGLVDFQLSADDGATWLRWDSAGWVSDGLWNTWEEVDEGIVDFPLQGQIKFRIRLRSLVDRLSTPILTLCVVGVEVEYDFNDDIIRSSKIWMDDNLSILLGAFITCAGSSVVLTSIFAVQDVVGAYDESADPKHQNNLFSSYDPLSGTITLTSAVNGTLFVKFHGFVEVTPSADVDFNVNTIPAIYFYPLAERRHDGANWSRREFIRSLARNMGKIHQPRVYNSVDVQMYCVANDHTAVLAMSDSIESLLCDEGRKDSLRSRSTGNRLIISEVEPYKSTERLSDDVWCKRVDFCLTGVKWIGDAREYPLITDVRSQVDLV